MLFPSVSNCLLCCLLRTSGVHFRLCLQSATFLRESVWRVLECFLLQILNTASLLQNLIRVRLKASTKSSQFSKAPTLVFHICLTTQYFLSSLGNF